MTSTAGRPSGPWLVLYVLGLAMMPVAVVYGLSGGDIFTELLVFVVAFGLVLVSRGRGGSGTV